MKILFILHSSIMGGATISFLNLASGLVLNKHSLVVVTPDKDRDFSKKLDLLSIRYYFCPIVMSVLNKGWTEKTLRKKIGSIVRLLKKKVESFQELEQIIKQEKPDLIHTNVGVVHEGFFCARRHHIPHVWHLREYQDLDFSWRVFPSKCFFRHLLKRSSVISITKGIHRHFGLKEDSRHRVVYNGVLPMAQKEMHFPKQDFFLCASRISKEKGHEDVIRAFSFFLKTHPSYKLIILGFDDSGYIDFLKNLCVELAVDDSVVFQGYTDNVISFMADARGLIVASYNEGFGRMTAEAAFCGCLVIGRNTAGTKEILEETGGFTFYTREELFEEMCRLADLGQTEYADKATFSQEKAVNLYSVEQNVAKIISFYEFLLAESS